MRTFLQILSAHEQSQVHERSLRMLENTSVQVDSERGRQIPKEAGALVDEGAKVAYLLRDLMGEWQALAPKKSTLGAMREGWDAAGRPTLVEEARERVRQILASHDPLPLHEDAERELQRIRARAEASCQN